MKTSSDQPLLPIGPMASRIGVQPKELRAEADAGTIPCVRVGLRGLLFDPIHVEAALRARARPISAAREGSTSVSKEVGDAS